MVASGVVACFYRAFFGFGILAVGRLYDVFHVVAPSTGLLTFGTITMLLIILLLLSGGLELIIVALVLIPVAAILVVPSLYTVLA